MRLLSSPATFYAVMSSVAFAMQHPFTKLAAGGQHSVLFLAFCAGVLSSMIGGAFALYVIPVGWKEVFRFLADTRNLLGVVVSAILSVGSALIYMWCISFTSVLILSLMLNTSPLWGALWGRLLEKNKLRPAFYLTVILAFAVIVAGSVASYREGLIVDFSYWSFLAILVPAIFVLRQTYMTKFFARSGNTDNFDSNIATIYSGLITSIIVGALWVFLLLEGVEPAVGQIDYSLLMVAIGSLAVFVGTQLSLRAHSLSKNDAAYVTAFNMLIPAFSTAIAWLLAVSFDVPTLYVSGVELLQALCLILVLANFAWQNGGLSFGGRKSQTT